MSDEIQLGEVAIPLTGDAKFVNDIVSVAWDNQELFEYEEYTLNFIESMVKNLEQRKNRLTVSSNQKELLEQIKICLQNEDLLD